MTALYELTASEAAEKMARDEITAEALAASCSERIAEKDGEVQAWAYIDPKTVLDQARMLDRGPKRGPIHGVPFALKDIIDTVDMPTGYGSPIYDGYRPGWDAPCVTACRVAGGLLLGKSVTTEFAHRFPGKTQNPYNPNHTPGGSSSGSAAAVGAHMVPVAFGTQTGGSTIRPAAYCGAVGYKPTYADISPYGVRANVPSFDTVGLIARSVDDLALFRYAAMSLPGRALGPAKVSDLRIGLCRSAQWDKAEPSTQALIEETADRLARAGARVTDFTMPDGAASMPGVLRKIAGFEFARVMLYERTHFVEKLSRDLLDGRVADGECSYEDYRTAERNLFDYRQRLYAAMEGYDVLLTPSAPGEAPKGLKQTGDSTFNSLWTASHVPAVTLPVGTGPNELPLGVQLVGGHHEDHRLLEAAKAVCQHLGSWR